MPFPANASPEDATEPAGWGVASATRHSLPPRVSHLDPLDPPSRSRAGTDARIGMEIGKYLVTRRLGGGGMGVVYEARDKVLRRNVAIKFFAEAVNVTPDAVKRFVLEAQAAARLNHPNVVAVFEMGKRAGVYFLVMELVPGDSAAEQLQRHGRFDWAEATRIASDACRGLAAAHAASLIHRDIKPANLLLVPDGGASSSRTWQVKVADFGLAKLMDGGASMVTAGDRVVGTPHYMSPEQCRSEVLDPRSDLYSLGATYFSLLTGQMPFAGEQAVHVMFAHCWRPPPDPREIDSSIPAACSAIVRRALAKEPCDRYRSALQMLADLEGALFDPSATPAFSGEPSHRPIGRDPVPAGTFDAAGSIGPAIPLMRQPVDATTPIVQPRRRGLGTSWWLAPVLCLLVAGGGTAAWFEHHRAPANNHPAALAYESLPAPSVNLRWSADAGGSVATVLFSPDGRKIIATACDNDGGVRGWDVADGRPFFLAASHQPCGAATFAADAAGQALYYGVEGKVVQWSLVQEVALNEPLAVSGNILSVSQSHDQRVLAVLTKPAGTNTRTILKLFDAGDKEIAFPADQARGVIAVNFLGQTNLLATSGMGPTLHLWDVSRNSGGEIRILPLSAIDTEIAVTSISASRDGKVIAAGGRKSLRFYDLGGHKLGQVFRGEHNVRCVALSADGKIAAVGSGSDVSDGAVTLYNVPGGDMIAEVNVQHAAINCVALSPDARLLATGSTDRAIKVWELDRLLNRAAATAR